VAPDEQAVMEARCTKCAHGHCEDCLTFGRFCECCGTIFNDDKDDDA
jgi:hypothetical protein